MTREALRKRVELLEESRAMRRDALRPIYLEFVHPSGDPVQHTFARVGGWHCYRRPGEPLDVFQDRAGAEYHVHDPHRRTPAILIFGGDLDSEMK
jgi:hypothetical protein